MILYAKTFECKQYTFPVCIAWYDVDYLEEPVVTVSGKICYLYVEAVMVVDDVSVCDVLAIKCTEYNAGLVYFGGSTICENWY